MDYFRDAVRRQEEVSQAAATLAPILEATKAEVDLTSLSIFGHAERYGVAHARVELLSVLKTLEGRYESERGMVAGITGGLRGSNLTTKQ